MTTGEKIRLLLTTGVLIIVLSILILIEKLDFAQAIQITITFVLALITYTYVTRTKDIAEATRQQAEASVKMAEEMEAQRIMAARPVIVPRDTYESNASDSPPEFTGFELYNLGNGPAIEIEISVFNKDKTRRSSEKRSFFKASESINFYPDWNLKDYIGSTCYLVAEYQSIYSRDSHTWYQTWLPFRINQFPGTDKIIILPDNLEFREVSEKDRIDAFGSRSKPK